MGATVGMLRLNRDPHQPPPWTLPSPLPAAAIKLHVRPTACPCSSSEVGTAG